LPNSDEFAAQRSTFITVFLGSPFSFLDPGELMDGDFRLTLHETSPAIGARAPAYRFYIRRVEDLVRIGRIELRLANTPDILLYVGHIGYNVDYEHRGHRYAARASRLLYELARRHGFSELWITCDPDNLPSRRSCELAGGQFVSIVAVPESHAFYRAGSHAKCRFRVDLTPGAYLPPLDPSPAALNGPPWAGESLVKHPIE
jgi:tagatose 1,6-diphosphate aldolase